MTDEDVNRDAGMESQHEGTRAHRVAHLESDPECSCLVGRPAEASSDATIQQEE